MRIELFELDIDNGFFSFITYEPRTHWRNRSLLYVQWSGGFMLELFFIRIIK